MMKPRISMISLAVRDLATATAFYEKGLGLPRFDSPAAVSFFDLNGTWLGLCERQALADDAGVSADGDGYRGFSISHNVADPEDVDRLYKLALSAGARAVKAPQKAHWGGYHAYFADPDGHLWEIAHNPFGWIGPKDDD